MSKEYWENREKERLDLIDISVDERIKDIEDIMNNTVKKLEHEILKLYEKYANDNELSYQEALLYLNDNERKEFQKDLKYYIETSKNREKSLYRSELQALSTRARVKRLEVLKANIKIQSTELERLLMDEVPSTFNSVYQDSYFYNLYSQCLYTDNLGLRFDIPSPNVIKELLNNPWSGKNYSDKVWNLTSNFNYKLDSVITSGLIRGEHPNIIARNLKEATLGKRDKEGNIRGGKLYDCKRLVRTEAAFIAEQAAKKSYDANNIKEYEYLATLDLRTSLVCQVLDGKIFKVKDAVTGLNYPPMHCFCRSTTVPVIKWDGENDTSYERISRDPITGRNSYIDDIDYSTWKDKQYSKYDEDIVTKEIKKISNRASDKKQYERYKKELGDIIPKDFTKFQDLKYNNKELWDRVAYNYKLKTIYNLDRLKNTQNFVDIKDIKHILEGDVNRNNPRRIKAVGYHLETIPSKKGEIIGVKTKADKNGIYKAKVKVEGIVKKLESSFFPIDWTPQQVIDAINEAYANKIEAGKSAYIGKTSYGFDIFMYMKTTDPNKIATAYPVYEKDKERISNKSKN